MTPITCRLRELSDSEKLLGYPLNLQPGDMWYSEEHLTKHADSLSPYYRANNAHRPPLMIVLPNGDWFLIDCMACKDDERYGNGWTVTGNAPLITVSPSIHIVGRWHGWLKNGVLETC